MTPSPRENGNPRQDVVLENPALYYSAVKKDKQNLRKKVVRHAAAYDHDGTRLGPPAQVVWAQSEALQAPGGPVAP